jgi:hypothetical protein
LQSAALKWDAEHFNSIAKLGKVTGYMDHLVVKEAIEI